MNKFPFEELKRTILVKRNDFGKISKKESQVPIEALINYGIINIDKPKGPTKALLSEVPIRLLNLLKRFLVLTKLDIVGL